MDIVSDDLTLILMGIAKDTIESVSKKIVNSDMMQANDDDAQGVIQKSIWQNTYAYDYYPNKAYYLGTGIPTFQFFRAFKWRDTVITGDTVTKELYYDWESMLFDPYTGLHGFENIDGTFDLRESLADILNQYVEGDEELGVKGRRPFWDIAITDLFMDNDIETLFDSELSDLM